MQEFNAVVKTMMSPDNDERVEAEKKYDTIPPPSKGQLLFQHCSAPSSGATKRASSVPANKRPPRQVTAKSKDKAGALSVEVFKQAFTQVPKCDISSARELKEKVNTVCATLENSHLDWDRRAAAEDSKEDRCNQLFLRGFCLTSDDTTALLMVCISAPTFDVASTPDWAAVCDWSTLERHSAVQEKECTSMALMIFLCIGMSVICAILGVAIGYGFSSSSRRKEEKTDEKVIESHSTDKKKEENPDEKVTQSHSTDKKKEEA